MKFKPKSTARPQSTPISSPEQLRAAAIAYATAGFVVIPLSGIRDAVCECGKEPSCKRPGKHPRIRGWRERATSDASIVAGWWDTNQGWVAEGGGDTALEMFS